MDQSNPFSTEELTKIFSVSVGDYPRLLSRESGTLEFKQSFGWGGLGKYLKTCAAYANARGGYIVFGISPIPHKLLGLTPEALKIFESIDPEKLTEAFNNHFAPEIEWDKNIHETNNAKFGLLYIQESVEKPVMCIKNDSGDIKEGEIYYRYRGQSKCIKYSELRSIIESRRANEQKIWMSTLSQIARIGVEDVGVFNINTGLVTGKGINSFLIDESLLSQLSFVKEGEFSEIKGKPTLKLIGNLQAVDSIPLVIGEKQRFKTKGIYIPDIILNFLEQNNIPDPQEYLQAICYQTTSSLPIYYYIHLSKKSVKTTVETLIGMITRGGAKQRVIERLNNKTTHRMSIHDKTNKASKKKLEYVDKIKSEYVVIDKENEDLKLYLQAILSLSTEEITESKVIICQSVKIWFNKYYSNVDPSIVDLLRRTICWIDEALYMDKCR